MLGNFPQFSGQLYFFEHPTNTPRVSHVDTMFEREINVMCLLIMSWLII